MHASRAYLRATRGHRHVDGRWGHVSRWLTGQVLPHVPPNALIILEAAGAHQGCVAQAFPPRATRREEMRAWLTRTHLPWRDAMLPSARVEVCRRFAPTPDYTLDQIAAAQGHRLWRTPPYHPALQPLATGWALVTHSLADHGDVPRGHLRTQVPRACSHVTADSCHRGIIHVVEHAETCWMEDAPLDEISSQDGDGTHVGEDMAEDLAAASLLEGTLMWAGKPVKRPVQYQVM